ncbi:hypothetical protein KQI22_10810 [Kineothrix sp. MSJ-39]|uniref:hypothetical protein n=1 Tax=Kineothrix sp. MSJ-39 TaxID=2841533 RepID=UPI001C123BA6|nr:hypothetical protein [Kineothrix sp. MSJ-39]MBU5430548.1 hypothetical protein [Kineothrix sp. MSJ-39]
MDDYFYYLTGEKPEKAPSYVDIEDYRIWGVWIKEEKLLQHLTDRTIRHKKAEKKSNRILHTLLRHLWKRKFEKNKKEEIPQAACVDFLDPMHKVASEALEKRLPGEDLLKWDFPGKLYLAFGRAMLRKLFEEQGQITLFCLLSEETDHELPQFLAEHALCLRELVFFAPAYGTDRAEDMLEEIYEETGLVGSCSGYGKLPLYLAAIQQYESGDAGRGEQLVILDENGEIPVAFSGAVYIAAHSSCAKRKIRGMQECGMHCKTLRKYLDSTFLSGL